MTKTTATVDSMELDPMLAGPFVIGYVDAIHGKGAECQAVTITRSEAECLVRRYLADIAAINENWELFGSTGSWEIRAKPYALQRIDALIESGIIDAERVKDLAAEAFKPLNEILKEREKRFTQIVSALDAVIEEGKGKVGDIVFDLGGEGFAPEGWFFVKVERAGECLVKKCADVPTAVEWLRGLIVAKIENPTLPT